MLGHPKTNGRKGTMNYTIPTVFPRAIKKLLHRNMIQRNPITVNRPRSGRMAVLCLNYE